MVNNTNTKDLEDLRKIRAYAILSKGDTPEQVNEETYTLPSQSNPDKKYTVSHHEVWTCTCPDYKKRGLKCKHIQAVEMWTKLRDTVMDENALDIKADMENVPRCDECGSVNLVKDGVRKNKHGEKQRYRCKDCGHRFVNDRIKGYKVNAKLIALSLDLYFKGLSLRKITDVLEQCYAIDVHHETVRRWINTFMDKINEYVNKLEPNVGDVWHTDEQKIKAEGEWWYSWNILDEKTRFLIANEVTKERSILETEMVMKKSQEQTKGARPQVMITDGMSAYPSAVRGVYGDETMHIGNVGIRDKINNNVLERYHGTYRERDKVMRGLENNMTAREMNENIRTYYNFVRGHTALGGRTPAEEAGIHLSLGRNKMYGLLQKAVTPECDRC